MNQGFTPVEQFGTGDAGNAPSAGSPNALPGTGQLPPPPAPTGPYVNQLDDPDLLSASMSAAKAPLSRNPGPFDQTDAVAKRVLTPDVFDGCRFDIQKVFNPNFAASHVVWMGTSQIPTGHMYNFGTNYVAQTALGETLLIGRVSPNGNVDAQWHQVFNDKFKTKTSWNISGDGSKDMLAGDMELKGETFTAAAKLGQTFAGASYMQGLTTNFAVGGEVFNHFAQKKTHVFARGRYNDHDCTATATWSTMGTVAANYVRKVDDRVNLAAEIELSTANLNSHLMLGYEFNLKQAQLRGTLSSTGTIMATMTENIFPGFNVLFSAVLDHKANKQQFGVGVRIG